MVSKIIFITFALLELTFFTGFIAHFTGASGWVIASGYFGLFTAAAGEGEWVVGGWVRRRGGSVSE